MKVLLTNLTLASRTGTEVVTRDLALGLARAGYEVCVFSPLLGAVADEITASGVPVVSRLEDVPFRPDIIHGHHHVETTLALVHFRSVPAVFVCHDRLSWHDSPPRLNAIRRYVAVDWNCLERLVNEAGIPEERTQVILNAVDLRRFRQRRRLPDKPARALVFSNYATENADLETLRRACIEAGLEIAIVGKGMAAQASRPEEILGDYDLVFAKARCALEALASGCAVILYDWQGLGPMVTSEQVQELRKWNFGMRCLQMRLTADDVQREIARYDPADAARVTEFIRADASLDKAVAEYVRLYEEVLAESGDVCVSIGDATDSLARKVGSLESLLRSAAEPLAMPPLPLQAIANIGLRLSDRIHRMPAGAATQVFRRDREPFHGVACECRPISGASVLSLARDRDRAVPCVRWRADAVDRRRASPVAALSRDAVLAPQKPGQYVLVLTMVQEGKVWFDQIPQPVAVECAGHRGLGRLRTAGREDPSRGCIVDVRPGGARWRVRKPGIPFRPQGLYAHVRRSPPVRCCGPGLSAGVVHNYQAGVSRFFSRTDCAGDCRRPETLLL